MSGGSLQMRLYRRARRDGVDRLVAANRYGIGDVESQLTDREDALHPPAPECYRLSPDMARGYVGDLADTPLGAAMVSRLTEE